MIIYNLFFEEMNYKNRKVWLFQIPRLNDELTAGIKEVSNILKKNLVECEIIDINHEIYKKFYNTEDWKNIELFGIQNSFSISNIPIAVIDSLFKKLINPIKKNDIILISVFSVESRSWALLITILIRKYFKKTVRIGLGGSGLRDPGETLYECEWANKLLDTKLCDFLFLGESSIILKKQIDNSFNINGKLYDENNVFPDIGFLPLELIRDNTKRFFDPGYVAQNLHGEIIEKHNKKKKAKIYFTQGCVKKCTFCDVPSITPHWAMRSAEKVIDEIDYYYNLDRIIDFSFPDNTINGSDSEFLKFLQLLEKWQNKNENITWSSQFSIKSKRQQPEIMFDLLAKTGARLSIGFDHCSNNILKHMKKLYTWEDCQYFMSLSLKYKLNIDLAMWIVGYPTETLEDFLEYNKLINFLKNKENLIKSHSVLVCSINKNSKLLNQVTIDWKKPSEWKSNIGIDKQIRLERKTWLDNKLLENKQNYYKYTHNLQRLDNV